MNRGAEPINSLTSLIRSKKLIEPSLLAIVGFEVTPDSGKISDHFLISSNLMCQA